MTLSVKPKAELLDGPRPHQKNNVDHKSPELNKGRPAGMTLKPLSGNKHYSLPHHQTAKSDNKTEREHS